MSCVHTTAHTSVVAPPEPCEKSLVGGDVRLSRRDSGTVHEQDRRAPTPQAGRHGQASGDGSRVGIIPEGESSVHACANEMHASGVGNGAARWHRTCPHSWPPPPPLRGHTAAASPSPAHHLPATCLPTRAPSSPSPVLSYTRRWAARSRCPCRTSGTA